jgi:hypothetical protein
MFIQVFDNMTSCVITSHSKERPFVLLHSQAIFSVSQQRVHQFATLQAQSPHQGKKYLREDLILPELLLDNLSGIPEYVFS